MIDEGAGEAFEQLEFPKLVRLVLLPVGVAGTCRLTPIPAVATDC